MSPTKKSEIVGPEKAGDVVTFDVNGDKASLITLSETVRTVEQALAKAEIDLDEWEQDRCVVNSWEVGAKGPNGAFIQKVPLWQVKVWLKRKVPEFQELVFDLLLERLKKYRPATRKAIKTSKSRKTLLEIALFDPHFGKLAWRPETGTHYDLKIASALYLAAVQDLLAKSHPFGVRSILLPIGNDFLHVDNDAQTTHKGTPQDVEGRLPKIIETAVFSVIQAVDYCRQVAPVELVWVPGNHDPQTSYFMARELAAWFRNDKGVTVDCGPAARKYRQHGTCLIGYTHGNEEAIRDLVGIMASEVPDLWASSESREWHIGHTHKRKETVYLAGDTFNGVSVRVLPSLSGTDKWHYLKGYVKTTRAAEAYLWHQDDGYVGHVSANVRAET